MKLKKKKIEKGRAFKVAMVEFQEQSFLFFFVFK